MPRHDHGVTRRVVLISLALLTLLAPVSFYVEQLVKVSWGFSGMVPPIAAVGTLFLLVAANHALATPSTRLSR